MARPWSSFFWPGSKVLKNRLGITDGPRLEEAEYDVAELRMQQLLANPSLVTATDPVQRLQQVHAHLFGDLYDWAGELRDFDLSKGRSVFASHEKAGAMFRHGAKQLRPQTWTSRRRAVGDLADAFGWLNHAHPFREGNGRATRTYLRLALREHGLDLDVSAVDKKRWVAASIMSSPRETWFGNFTVSPGTMKPLLAQMVQPARAIQPVDEATIQRVVDGHRSPAARQAAAARSQRFAALADAYPSPLSSTHEHER